MKTFLPVTVGHATLSACETYRYDLVRNICGGRPCVNFIMLNPSTADASEDDPTIRRCVSYAERWGFGKLVVTNLFAYRSTDPKKLDRIVDPIGPGNNEYLLKWAKEAALVVAAWGAKGDKVVAHEQRPIDVQKLLEDYPLYYLRLTRHGQPCHPLYLPGNLKPLSLGYDVPFDVNSLAEQARWDDEHPGHHPDYPGLEAR